MEFSVEFSLGSLLGTSGCGWWWRSRRSSRNLVRLIDLVRIADMDVREKISKEARRAVMARAEGLPTWKPAAPGIGANSM